MSYEHDRPLSKEEEEKYIDEWMSSGWEWGDPTGSIIELWKEANKNGAKVAIEYLLKDPYARPFVRIDLRPDKFLYVTVSWGPMEFVIEKTEMDKLPYETVEGGEEGDEYYWGQPKKLNWGGE